MINYQRGNFTNSYGRFLFYATIILCSAQVFAQAPSGSNLWIGSLSVSDSDNYVIKGLTKLTDNKRYTNQPYFLDDHRLLYTQEVTKKDGTAQMDIFLADLFTQSFVNLTNSDASEYSATPTPDGKGFSVIRVNEQNKQELWQYDFNGKPVRHLLPAIEPVGYHVWLDDSQLLLFVLGEPHRLVLADINIPNTKGLDVDIQPGPSLFRVPETKMVSYTKLNESSSNDSHRWQLMITSEASDYSKGTASVFLPDGGYYYNWADSKTLLSSKNGTLISINVENNSGFKTIVGSCDSEVTRVALGQDNKIALVCAVDE